MPSITIEISEHAAGRLEQLCRKSRQSHHLIAERAIELFVDTEEWQLSDIEHGLSDARDGHLISEEQAGQVFNQLLS
ncbi:CopG family ribbon-helix-helix protein [Gellertiella hungarica]|uniref:Putative transcriptional regulator n=1 Tax=Gellertiella hungarica TaxID=1572859 RepID=A0A7W6NKK6_9HYPH|nr:ribbon-helix-helix protein, CopG family [Gellertiella hungarica]MBB4064495.1 putative transcriptional regulator [Gellertiella hungarica]